MGSGIFLLLAATMLSTADGNPGSGDGDRDFTQAHEAMMQSVHADVARNSKILGRNHLSEPVALAMAKVQRHLFVPEQFWQYAYENRPLPIGHDQTISQPTIVALMTDLLGLSPADTVLEIGTGSGYQAAVLSEVLPEGKVFTIEIVPDLAHNARIRLQNLGYDNVRVIAGDGYIGLQEKAPFAGIIVTAAAEEIPPPLLEQLAPGGRLVMPVGEQGETQWLTVVTKDAKGKVDRRVVLPVRFVPLTGERVK